MRRGFSVKRLRHYREDVEHRAFPADEESYHLSSDREERAGDGNARSQHSVQQIRKA